MLLNINSGPLPDHVASLLHGDGLVGFFDAMDEAFFTIAVFGGDELARCAVSFWLLVTNKNLVIGYQEAFFVFRKDSDFFDQPIDMIDTTIESERLNKQWHRSARHAADVSS